MGVGGYSGRRAQPRSHLLVAVGLVCSLGTVSSAPPLPLRTASSALGDGSEAPSSSPSRCRLFRTQVTDESGEDDDDLLVDEDEDDEEKPR